MNYSDYQAKAAAIAKRKALAEQLTQASMSGGPGLQVVSGRVVKRGALSSLLPIAQALTGAYAGRQAEKEGGELEKQRGAEIAAALAGVQSQQDPAARRQATVSLQGLVASPEDNARAAIARELSPKLEKIDVGNAINLVDETGATRTSLPKAASPDAQLGANTMLSGQKNTADIAAAERASREAIEAAQRKTIERGQDISANTAVTTAESRQGAAAGKNIQSLRKEFRSLPSVKSYEATLPIVESVKNAPDTPAGDLQVVYSVGKALDPDSVVREGELELTQNATPILQKIAGKARAELAGQGRLTPETRKDLIDMLEQRTKGYQEAYTRDYDTYAGYAKDVGADAGQIVGTRPETAFGGNGQTPQAPPEAVEFLRQNPQYAEQFKAKFGYLPQ